MVHTLLVRIKACQMAARVEATLYREKELSIMREISVVRSEVRFMVRTKNERDVKNCADRRRDTINDTYTAEQFRQIMMKVLPTWAASTWNPRATAPSQTLWRFLLTKALTLLSHHTILRGAIIREITLPNIFLYRLASTSSVKPGEPAGRHGDRRVELEDFQGCPSSTELRRATLGSGVVRHR
ncbi:unnamed protein product [Closterium sp. NIES-53]